jgi:hypothetical protein
MPHGERKGRVSRSRVTTLSSPCRVIACTRALVRITAAMAGIRANGAR